jgi:hypothetical protein
VATAALPGRILEKTQWRSERVLRRPSIDTEHGARLLTGGFGTGEAKGCALDWETVSRKRIRTGTPTFKWRRERGSWWRGIELWRRLDGRQHDGRWQAAIGRGMGVPKWASAD